MMFKVPILLSAVLLTSSAFAATINIAPCSSGGGCMTLNDAIAASSPGDIIEMSAGTYSISEQIDVNKALTIRGQNAVISTMTGVMISGSNVTLEGLTIRDAASYGVWIRPGVDGTTLNSNTITNNTTGINLGGVNTTIVNNVISNNNNGDPSYYGYGIYTDETAGGQMRNIVLQNNTFEGNKSTDIAINITNSVSAMESLSISGNTFRNGGRAIYLINTRNVRIANNKIENMGTPIGGKESTAIGLWGGNRGVVVTGNQLERGNKYGIYIQDMGAGTNLDLKINRNHIAGYAVAGMYVEGGTSLPALNAKCNWWGAASGPRNAIFNSDGRGDAIRGKVASAQVDPWLTTSNLNGDCAGAPAPVQGFAGFWEHRSTRSCIAISQDETEAMSFRKCGPFRCERRKGSFTAYESGPKNGDDVRAYGFINYHLQTKADQELELLSSVRMRVSDVGRVSDGPSSRSLIYNKVTRCQWHPKWPFPKPRPPKPNPPTPSPTPN
ncbi:nitrous oxide reductase family maturation protein NosD [Bdellovibrio sp. HCB290]|uniref:right-handed parallel beta-helix repeat-containing protein n=1 Tax=Bdellovibrio sp. HCB290 TaxID=3394356 RepID=UPI0039B4655E